MATRPRRGNCARAAEIRAARRSQSIEFTQQPHHGNHAPARDRAVPEGFRTNASKFNIKSGHPGLRFRMSAKARPSHWPVARKTLIAQPRMAVLW